MSNRRPWLTGNLKVLSGVSLLQDAASELLYPILPIFLTVTLGAPAAVVGAVEGAAEGVAAGTKLLAGRLSDRYRARPLIALGYGLAALGKLLLALASVWPVVLAGRCVDRLGKGVRGAPRDALLMVDADPSARGRVFGFHRAADTAGAVIGPALGLGLYELFDHRLRPLLLIAVVPAVLSVLLVAAVREAPREVRPERVSITHPAALSPQLRRLIGVLAIFGLVNFPDALLLLRAHELGLSTGGVIGAYIAYNAVYAAASYPAGALSDRWPRHLVFALGLLFFAVGYLGLGLVDSPGLVFVLLPLYGGFAACTDGVGKAWVASLAPTDRQGGAQGLYQALTGGAILVAGLWAGLAWGGDGTTPLLLSGSLALVLAVALAVAGGRLVDEDVSAHQEPVTLAERRTAARRSRNRPQGHEPVSTPEAPTSEELEHLVLMATCAPSVHNTQPWTFVPAPDGLLLEMDRSRQLTVLDPNSRELLVSCGAAVHHLQVAARALGLDTAVEILPQHGGADTVAQLRLGRGKPATEAEVATAVAILHRHTHRGRFADEHVPDALLDLLRLAVEGQGAMLRVVKGDELVEVEVLVSRAEQSLLHTPGYAAELSRWVWHGTADQQRGDGMPEEAVDHGPDRAESLQGRRFDAAPTPRPDEPPTPEHPTVVVLSTASDTPHDWVQAGCALSAMLLAATEHGILAQPIGQVIDVPSDRLALQRLLGTIGAPQMMLRLGLGTSVPLSPRRPVTEVLDP